MTCSYVPSNTGNRLPFSSRHIDARTNSLTRNTHSLSTTRNSSNAIQNKLGKRIEPSTLTKCFDAKKSSSEDLAVFSPSSNLITGYSRSSLLYMIVFGTFLVAPIVDPILPFYFPYAPIERSFGYGIAGGVMFILRHAAELLRLNSDTYKRLNLGVFMYSVLSLCSILFESTPRIHLCLLIPPFIAGMWCSATGWISGVLTSSSETNEYDVVGREKTNVPSVVLRRLKTELLNGFTQTITCFRKAKHGTYLPILYSMTLVMFSSVFQFVFSLAQSKETMFVSMGSEISILARRSLLFSMILTLKDASERKRLSGTTFIQLNVILGIWSFVVGFIPVWLNPYNDTDSLMRIVMFLIGSIFFKKAYDGVQAKKDTIERETMVFKRKKI